MTTYEVGPGLMYSDLTQVAPLVAPGDTVEIDGGATYAGGAVFATSGTASAKITIRGLSTEAGRPRIDGGSVALTISGSHYVVEGVEITGATSSACLALGGDDLSIDDAIIHDCGGPAVRSDAGAGAQTLSYVEVYSSGSAAGSLALAGAKAHVEHAYLHAARGGATIASLASRTEIYSSWLEGGASGELALAGDSDVVGNVIVGAHGTAIATVGGASGRFRFVNDTILAPSPDAGLRFFSATGAIESLEIDDDVIAGAPGLVVIDDAAAAWTTGSAILVGVTNWIDASYAGVPPSIGALRGSSAGVSFEDPRPMKGGPLVDAGTLDPKGPAGHALPMALAHPLFDPPPRALEMLGSAIPRSIVGPIDIGAYELGDATSGMPDAGVPVGPPLPGNPNANVTDTGCAVHPPSGSVRASSEDGPKPNGGWFVFVLAGVLVARRALRSSQRTKARRRGRTLGLMQCTR